MLEDKQVQGWASSLPTACPPSLSCGCLPATGRWAPAVVGAQPVHAGHRVNMSGAEVLRKGALLRSRGIQQAWSDGESGGRVFSRRGAGEGWLRQGQVLGSGEEGDGEDILENNGRERLGMEKKQINRSLEDNAVGKEEALVTGGGGRTKKNKRGGVRKRARMESG